ncbi:hypothetical protein EON65_10885 [archaeon]|nr:MAG: hypothetical protein EON65_10885 [archaeon]
MTIIINIHISISAFPPILHTHTPYPYAILTRQSSIRDLLTQLANQDDDPLSQDVSQDLLVSQAALLGCSK